MSFDAHKNFAKATVSTGYLAVATSIVLAAGGGARFPATSFNATWWNSTDYPDPADDPLREIVRVTDISTETLTITRGQESTSAQAHNLSGKVYKLVAGVTAETLTDIEGAIPTYNHGQLLRTVIEAQLVSPVIHVYSDSTGVGNGDGGAWYQASLALAALYPQCTHRFSQWDDVAQIVSPPHDLFVSNLGRRGMVMRNTGNFAPLVYISGNFTNPSGDIDIQVNLMPPGSWTSGSGPVVLVGRSTDGSSGFLFELLADGRMVWASSNNGSGFTINQASTASVPFDSSSPGWVRVWLDVDNGSSGYDLIFYTSSDGITWTQLGTTLTGAGTQSVNWTSSGDYNLGAWSGGAHAVGFTFFGVRFAKSFGGISLFPEAVETWTIPADSWTMIGGSTVTWYVVAKGGTNEEYWTTERIASSMIPGMANFVIMNNGVNFGSIGSFYLGILDSFVARINTQLGATTTAYFMAVIQNSQVPNYPTNNLHDYPQDEIRHVQIAQWARAQGFDLFNVSSVFSKINNWQNTLVSADGIHPTDIGYQIWGKSFSTLSEF